MVLNLEIIFYSILQGLTEFLPISSSAHLYFFEDLFSWRNKNIIFVLAAHLGTFVAVTFHQKNKILEIIFVDVLKKKSLVFINIICISVLPVLLLGAFLATVLNTYYNFSLLIVGIASIIGGIILGIADKIEKKKENMHDMSIKKALFIGLFQMLALVPGMSRSGTVITAMRLLGFDRNIAINFSLISGIPVIFSACIFGIYQLTRLDVSFAYDFLLICIFSFFSAYLSIKFLLNWVRNFSFQLFVIYRIFLGILIIFYYVY